MESDLTCAICSDIYLEGKREPVTLPECGHTFCRPCLLNIEKAGYLNCPYCRTKHHGQPVAQISTVYALLNLTKFFRKSKFGECVSHNSTLDFWCHTCHNGICGFCLYESHNQQNHEIVVMRDAIDKNKKKILKEGSTLVECQSNQKKLIMGEILDGLARVSDFCGKATSLNTSIKDIKDLMDNAETSLNMETVTNILHKMKEIRLLIKEQTDGYDESMVVTSAVEESSFPDTGSVSPGKTISIDKCMSSFHEDTNSISEDTASPSANGTISAQWQNAVEQQVFLTRSRTSSELVVSSPVSQRSEPSQIRQNDMASSDDNSDVSINAGWFAWSARADDGREGRLRWENNRLHLYTVSENTQENYGSIKLPVILSLLENSPEVFFDLSINDTLLGRVYIRIWGNLRRAQHFLLLCLGYLGPSYKGSRLNKVEGKDKPGECLRVNHYITSNGTTTARGLMDSLEWGGEYSGTKKEGLVVAASGGKTEYDGCIDICTRGNPSKKFSCPFGEVVSGLGFVKAATHHVPTDELVISNTGVVVLDQNR